MGEWFTYLLESSVSMALLYTIYALFLRRDTFFTINRFYLAASLVVAAIIPLFDFSAFFPETTVSYYYLLETISISPGEVTQAVSSHLSTFQVLLVVYLTGAAIFAIRFLVQISQLGALIRKYGITRKEGINLVLIHKEYSPFSFFNLIFINTKDYQPEQLREIIEHERVHVRQKHTLDLILLEIMTILQWFNPFIWLYRRSMKGLHEYLADEGVLLKGIKISEYQHMLLNQALGIQLNDLTNNFNQSLLKRRFIMMNKPKSGSLARLKTMLALPVILVMAMAFSFSGGLETFAQDATPPPPPKQNKNEVPLPPPPQKDAKTIEKVTKDGKEEVVFKEVSQMPEFKGGQEEFIKYIVANVKYPDEAKKKGTQGKVFVEFIVNKEGKITTAWIKKSVDPLLDAEALRVISTMPDWNPGKDENGKPVNVSMALPINFRLDENKTDKKKE